MTTIPTSNFTTHIRQIIPAHDSWTALFEHDERPVVCWALTGELDVVGLIPHGDHLAPVDLAALDPTLGPFSHYSQ